MIPPPVALGLMLCDQVIVEEGTRKVSHIGGFNSLRGREFPFDPLPFCVLATLTDGQGEAEITLTVTDLESDEETYSFNRDLTFPDRFAEVHILFRLNEITFPVPGSYMFTLMVDGDWIAQRRIRVRQTEVDT